MQSVYATNSTLRVIVLDLDIEGSDPDDPRIYRDHAAVQEHVVESYHAMPYEERRTLEKYLIENGSCVARNITMKPYSVLLLYPDTGDDPETYYTHTEAENPHAAIANARAEAQAVNPDMEAGDFLPLIVLPGHIEAELFYRDIAPW